MATLSELKISKNEAVEILKSVISGGYETLQKIQVDFKNKQPGKGGEVLSQIDNTVKLWEEKTIHALKSVYSNSQPKITKFKAARAERENLIPSEVDLFNYEAPLETRIRILEGYKNEIEDIKIEKWHETGWGKIIIGSILVVLAIILKAIWDKFSG